MPYDWLEDPEVSFRWHLVNDVNFMILEDASKNKDLHLFAHVALEGALWRVSCQQVEKSSRQIGELVYARFRGFAEELLPLAAAIETISRTHISEDILFSDTRAELDQEVDRLCKTATLYKQIAVLLNLEPIAVQSYVTGHPTVDATQKQLENYSRANALAHRGTRREFVEALQRLCPELVGV